MKVNDHCTTRSVNDNTVIQRISCQTSEFFSFRDHIWKIKTDDLSCKSNRIISSRKIADNNRRQKFVACIYRFRKHDEKKIKINSACMCA